MSAVGNAGFTKPISPELLVKTTKGRLRLGVRVHRAENVATILERETEPATSQWLERVEAQPKIIRLRLTTEELCAHLLAIFQSRWDTFIIHCHRERWRSNRLDLQTLQNEVHTVDIEAGVFGLSRRTRIKKAINEDGSARYGTRLGQRCRT